MIRQRLAMRRLLLVLTVALAMPLGIGLAWHWIHNPEAPPRQARPSRPRPQPPVRATPRSASTASATPAPPSGGVDPNLPLFVGDTRRLAARAIDDTAGAPLDAALVALARRFEGSPARPEPDATDSRQRLVLDLTGFDRLSFVEQLLALVNSRQVRTRTEAVDRFSDHVRQLRFGGRVERCRRRRDPSLWALAAERRGYLVDLSRFLPGAQRQPLSPASVRLGGHGPLHGTAGGTGNGEARRSQASERTTACSGEADLASNAWIATVPLAALPQALPSLRSGDLVVLVVAPGGAQARIGWLDLDQGQASVRWLEPDQGVVRRADLRSVARAVPGLIGLSFLRPLPNGDGRRR